MALLVANCDTGIEPMAKKSNRIEMKAMTAYDVPILSSTRTGADKLKLLSYRLRKSIIRQYYEQMVPSSHVDSEISVIQTSNKTSKEIIQIEYSLLFSTRRRKKIQS